ncbi:MAG: hypothetical protein DWQ31_11080 [Planctomycetota bacterium]|nr:MAG: hypothetical protein DWQ31_11080 [Planctomycetota bacterium]
MWLLPFVLLVLPAALPVAWAAESNIPLRHHAWGKFDKGAWQVVRVVTDTLDEEGNVTATTTTTRETTLVRVSNDTVKLKVRVTVDVGGKKFDAPEQVIVEGVHGEPEGETQVAKVLDPQVAEIDGKKILCQVHQFEIATPDETRTVKLYHSPEVAPHVLRRETVTTKLKGRRRRYRTTTHVVQLDSKREVLDEERRTAVVETVHQNNKGTTITESVHSGEIPGGVVAFRAEERNAEGQLVRTSRLELVDYGYSKKERRGRRVRRARRRNR